MRASLVAAFVSISAHSTQAQSRSVLHAFVFDSAGHPLSGAQLAIAGMDGVRAGDSTGTVLVAGVPYGYHVVSVRRLGYAASSARLFFNGSDTVEVEFDLDAKPATLATVDVRSRSSDSPNPGFAQRRATSAGGMFLTRADFRKEDTDRFSEILQKHLRSVHIVENPHGFGRWLASGERESGSLSGYPRADPQDPKSPRACWAQIILDGMRVYAPGREAQAVPDIDQFLAEHIAAVEYYAGPATTPPEWAGTGATCGTLVIWSRTAPDDTT